MTDSIAGYWKRIGNSVNGYPYGKKEVRAGGWVRSFLFQCLEARASQPEGGSEGCAKLHCSSRGWDHLFEKEGSQAGPGQALSAGSCLMPYKGSCWPPGLPGKQSLRSYHSSMFMILSSSLGIFPHHI